jgi:O-antigen/teichoic acid export membrane protein
LGESAFFFGALLILSPHLSSLIFSTETNAPLLRLVFVTGFFSVLDVVIMARLRARAQSGLYSLLSTVSFLVGLILNIYFIVVLRRGVEGLITAGLISAALTAVVYFLLLLKDLRPTFSLGILRRMLSFGIPLVPVGLSSLGLTIADRFFLQHYTTTAEVGLYSLGYNIALVINLMEQAFQLSWPPQMFTIAKKSDAEHQFARILTYYLLVFGFIGMALSVLSREVLTLMTTPRFYPAYKVVPLITLSYIFAGIRHITNVGLATKSKMKYVPPIITGSALLNIGLNFLLIPTHGMMGAAWATVISYFALVTVQIMVNHHFWPIRYEYDRIAKITLMWGMVYGISLLIRTPYLWLNLSLKLGLLVAYPFFLYPLRFYESMEVNVIKEFLRSWNRSLRAWRSGS